MHLRIDVLEGECLIPRESSWGCSEREGWVRKWWMSPVVGWFTGKHLIWKGTDYTVALGGLQIVSENQITLVTSEDLVPSLCARFGSTEGYFGLHHYRSQFGRFGHTRGTAFLSRFKTTGRVVSVNEDRECRAIHWI